MDDIWITGVLRKKVGIPDSCVLDSYFKADKHMFGYKDQGDPRSPGFMRKEWNKFAWEISKRPHFRCSYDLVNLILYSYLCVVLSATQVLYSVT